MKVADNCGAKTVRCIKVLGGFQRKIARLGDTIVVSVQELRNKSRDTSKVKKKEIYHGLIIKTKTLYSKKNGLKAKFNENAVILLNKQGNPVGTRILSPLPQVLKKKKYQKLIGMSSGLL